MTLEQLYRLEREDHWNNDKATTELALYHAHKVNKNVPLTFPDDVWTASKKTYDLETEYLIGECK